MMPCSVLLTKRAAVTSFPIDSEISTIPMEIKYPIEQLAKGSSEVEVLSWFD